MEQLYVITRKNNIINYIKNIYYIILTMNIDEIITKNKILEEELQKTNINLADKIIIIINMEYLIINFLPNLDKNTQFSI